MQPVQLPLSINARPISKVEVPFPENQTIADGGNI